MLKPKRVNKSKNQILDEMARKAKVERQKQMVRRIFPLLKVDTIYEMQTALSAVAGYLKEEIERKMGVFKVNDLPLDFKDEPKTKITESMVAIKSELQMDSAVEVMEAIELFANYLPSIGAERFLSKKSEELKVEDLNL